MSSKNSTIGSRTADRISAALPARGLTDSLPARAAHDFLVHTTLLQGGVGAAKALVACLLLSVPTNAALPVAGLVAFAVYTHNKLTDVEEDAVNDPGRVDFVTAHRGTFAGLSAGAYLLAVGVAALGGVACLALTLFPAAVGVLYSERLVSLGDADRLKDVLVVNTASVALAWAVPLTFLPLAFAGAPALAGAAFVAAFFFLRTFVGVEFFNVRDVAGDRREGVGTLPVAFGVRSTKRTLYALDAASLAVLAAGVFAGALPRLAALAVVPGVGYSLLVTSRLDAGVDLGLLCSARDVDYLLMAASLAALLGLSP